MVEPRVEGTRFEIGALLGRGGCAAVYRAVDRATGRNVALKVLEDGGRNHIAVARLAREGRAALAIKHENVCETLELGTLEYGHPYVAMELLEGETLRGYLQRRGPLDVEDVVDIGLQLLAGLDAAHQHGVLHRDVKPENVFLVQDQGRRVVKLVDFGICRSDFDRQEELALTTAGFVVGTPGYLAPEQVFGDGPIDQRADLFTVGLVLFEALTGCPAVRGRDALELAEALAGRVPSVRTIVEVPHALERIVTRATEPNPNDRYLTAAMFHEDLDKLRIRREVERLRRSQPTSDAWDVPTRRAFIQVGRRVA